MPEKELANIELGQEAKIDFDLIDGKLVLKVSYQGKGVGAGISVSMEPAYFIDKLTAAIPGTIDDQLGNLLKMALKIV